MYTAIWFYERLSFVPVWTIPISQWINELMYERMTDMHLGFNVEKDVEASK